MYERLGNGAEAFAVLTCLIPGMPLVYTGQEAGDNKRLSFFEKDLVEWKEHNFLKLYSKLFVLKKKNKSLHNGERGGELIPIKSSDEESIFAFTRSAGKDKVFAIFNLSKKERDFILEEKNLAGSYKNFLSGKLDIFTVKESFNLGPWEYKIFEK